MIRCNVALEPSAPTPTPVPDFTFTTGPSGSVEAVSPVSGTYSPVSVTVTVTGANALNNIVSLTESTLPAGITASVPNLQFIVQPSVTTPTQTVTFDITGSVAPGSYPITFTASSVDGPIHTATINLVVPGFSSSPNFAFTVTPGSLSIPYGTGPGFSTGSTGSPGSLPLTISVTSQNRYSDCVTVVGSDSTGGPDILSSRGIPYAISVLPGAVELALTGVMDGRIVNICDDAPTTLYEMLSLVGSPIEPSAEPLTDP